MVICLSEGLEEFEFARVDEVVHRDFALEEVLG
jgi:hypothetical protein